MSECPTCGDEFSSEQYMKVHYARVHGESIAGKSVECHNCGKTFRKKPNEIEENEHDYCSRDCWSVGHSQSMSDDSNPRWDGGCVNKQCDNCGEHIDVSRNRYKQKENHFCDRDCYGEWKAEKFTGQENHQWEGGKVKVNCENCGESKEVTPARLERSNRFFCDKSCKAEYWVEEGIYKGEKHPLWKGGVRGKYIKGYYSSRKKVLQRDGAECVICGSSEVQVHHIQPLHSFEQDELQEAHRKSNLVSLCPEHHTILEGRNKLSVDKIKNLSESELEVAN
jgi:hypothetical protein